MNSGREFCVVMRGPSAAVFRPNENLLLEKIPTPMGPVTVRYTSRWLTIADGVTVPGHLWIEIRGCAPDLESAIGPFANAGAFGLSIIATAMNASVGEPEIEIAFERTPGAKKREFFQSYLPQESGVISSGRMVNRAHVTALLTAIDRHPDAERLFRATNQYILGLRNWKFGLSTLALAHLWMAVEALTQVKKRAELFVRGLSDDQALANQLGCEKDKLDATVRRDLIFRGDFECYKQAKEASDGLEHGFIGYDRLFDLARQVRHRTASYVRSCICDLAGLQADVKTQLLARPFDAPLGHWPVAKYFRGELLTEGDDLAPVGSEYPFLRWNSRVQKCDFGESGELNITLSENLQPQLAEGASFLLRSFEAWQPD